jgi:hypothetical protein
MTVNRRRQKPFSVLEIKMPNESRSKPKSLSLPPAMNAIGFDVSALPTPAATPIGHLMTAWPEYVVDALQRSVLFLDLMRQRGNEEIEITSRPRRPCCVLTARC